MPYLAYGRMGERLFASAHARVLGARPDAPSINRYMIPLTFLYIPRMLSPAVPNYYLVSARVCAILLESVKPSSPRVTMTPVAAAAGWHPRCVKCSESEAFTRAPATHRRDPRADQKREFQQGGIHRVVHRVGEGQGRRREGGLEGSVPQDQAMEAALLDCCRCEASDERSRRLFLQRWDEFNGTGLKEKVVTV
eukprot:6177879-Pleurochrysis_carterae.AAC.1